VFAWWKNGEEPSMNKKQRDSYFGWRWPAACRTQGWDLLPHAQREERRKALTLEATGGATNSTQHLTENQITDLFTLLRLKTNPEDLDAALDLANPQQSHAKDECRRLVFAINSHGFHRNYVQGIADWYCRTHQVTHWEDLPAEKLSLLIRTVNARRAAKGMALPAKEPALNGSREYQLKPKRQYTPSLFKQK
jgi:hypothetical protein